MKFGCFFMGEKPTYKIYFDIRFETAADGVARVLHIRHWARRPLTNEELDELMDDQADDR